MYLVSIYFDEKTDKRLRGFIKQVAQKTGNTHMLDGNVPPHITLSAFETPNPENAIESLDKTIKCLKKGNLHWVSVSAFLPYVIYISPVLNEYLHEMSEKIYESISNIEDIRIRPNYQPFNWMPHTTIGKKLSPEEMRIAFEVLQKSFGMFGGEVVKIGVAKTNPYEDIKTWELK